MNKSQFMGAEPIPKLMLRLGIPSMLAQLVNMLYNIVDKIFLGHMPENSVLALGGIAVATPIIFIVSSFAAIVSGGGPPLAAIALGKSDKREAESIFNTSFSLLCIIAAVAMCFVYLFKTPLLFAFGASENNIAYADSYLTYYATGTFFVFAGTALSGFISAQGRADIAMRSVIIGALTNIILDPVFIYGLGLGVKGAAIATVIAQFLSAAYIYRFFCSKQSELKLRKQLLAPRLPLAKSIAKLGSSHFVMQSTEAAVAIVLNRQLLYYGGDAYVAALSIMSGIHSLVSTPLSGFNQGMQAILAYNYGAGNNERIKELIRRMLGIAITVKLLLQVGIMLFPELFASIFTKDVQVIQIVKSYIAVFLAGATIFVIQVVAQSFFVSTNKPVISLFVASLRKVILLIPFAYVFPTIFGVLGVYLAEGTADSMAGLVSAGILRRYYKRL